MCWLGLIRAKSIGYGPNSAHARLVTNYKMLENVNDIPQEVVGTFKKM